MTISHTPAELSTLLGSSIRTLRIDRNLKQVELAAQAGISLHALQNLESGEGATVRTLVTVLRALGREEWLKNLAPSPTINPLNLPRGASERKRARKSRPDQEIRNRERQLLLLPRRSRSPTRTVR